MTAAIIETLSLGVRYLPEFVTLRDQWPEAQLVQMTGSFPGAELGIPWRCYSRRPSETAIVCAMVLILSMCQRPIHKWANGATQSVFMSL
jgi:hypothetical protein